MVPFEDNMCLSYLLLALIWIIFCVLIGENIYESRQGRTARQQIRDEENQVDERLDSGLGEEVEEEEDYMTSDFLPHRGKPERDTLASQHLLAGDVFCAYGTGGRSLRHVKPFVTIKGSANNV